MPVPFELERLRVTSLDVDFHEVTWRLAPTSVDILDYTFTVLRSESPEGPWDDLSGKFEDRYSFVDNILQITNRWRQYQYLIRVTEKTTGEYKDFGPVAHEPEADIIATELRRHIRILMQEFAGRRCIVLPVRTFGQRCPNCWNNTLKKSMKSGCLLCYDTTFVRGYMHPIEAYIQIDPSSKSTQNTNVGKTQQDNSTMRLGYYPILKPDDIIVEAENIRWRVVSQTQTEHSRAAVHQEVQIHHIPEKDMEYAIPVHFDQALKNMYFTPVRNFTMAQNFSNFEKERMPDIFEMYGRKRP
jgi:hypothetical protein